MAYTVPKLTDYSEQTLVAAVDALDSALNQEADCVRNESEWKAFSDRWIARKNGIRTQVKELWLNPAPRESKPRVGVLFNDIHSRVERAVTRSKTLYENRAVFREGIEAYRNRPVDISLPGVRRPIGAEHPVIRTWYEIVSVFQKLGYSVAEGPVVETDYYNFEALNFPPNHPARDTQDTLFIAGSSRSRSANACCCARIRLRCRFALWRRCVRRCAL